MSRPKIPVRKLTEEEQQLITDNLGLVYSIGIPFSKLSNYEDIFQEGCLGLCLAAQRYDPDRGLKFSTFAYRYIQGKMLTYVRFNDTIKPSVKFGVLNKMTLCELVPSICYDFDEEAISDEMIIDKMRKVLTDKEQFVFQLLYDGMNKGDIASILGISGPKAVTLIGEVEEKAKSAIAEWY